MGDPTLGKETEGSGELDWRCHREECNKTPFDKGTDKGDELLLEKFLSSVQNE